MRNKEYVLINTDNYEFMTDDGDTTQNIFGAVRFDSAKFALDYIDMELDENYRDSVEVAKINFTYDLERVK